MLPPGKAELSLRKLEIQNPAIVVYKYPRGLRDDVLLQHNETIRAAIRRLGLDAKVTLIALDEDSDLSQLDAEALIPMPRAALEKLRDAATEALVRKPLVEDE